MTTSTVQLELQPRELLGKKVGRLRRAGIIPVHLYGPGIDPRSLQCAGPQLIQALSQAGASTPITVTITGESGSHMAFAREIQWDPRRDTVLHVDLLAADVSRPVTAQVSISLIGDSPGASRSGGNVIQQLVSVEVSALPLGDASSDRGGPRGHGRARQRYPGRRPAVAFRCLPPHRH